MAQNVYRCGNSYSAQPCPGGNQVEAADPRTPAQRQQAQEATERDARDAERLQRQRLKQDQARQGSARKPSDGPAQRDRSAPGPRSAQSAERSKEGQVPQDGKPTPGNKGRKTHAPAPDREPDFKARVPQAAPAASSPKRKDRSAAGSD